MSEPQQRCRYYSEEAQEQCMLTPGHAGIHQYVFADPTQPTGAQGGEREQVRDFAKRLRSRAVHIQHSVARPQVEQACEDELVVELILWSDRELAALKASHADEIGAAVIEAVKMAASHHRVFIETPDDPLCKGYGQCSCGGAKANGVIPYAEIWQSHIIEVCTPVSALRRVDVSKASQQAEIEAVHQRYLNVESLIQERLGIQRRSYEEKLSAERAAHLAELAKVRLEHQNKVTDLRKALRRVIREHSELLATIKEQPNLEANLFEARQALLTVGQEVIKQKEMLIWAFQHAQLGDEATTGQQEDFSDIHDKCRDYLYPDAQPKELASLKQQLDTCEALRIWQATELAGMQKELRGYASIEGKAHLQTIDERDAAEEALSQAYFLIKGQSPQWSNNFGHKEALEEIEDAQKCLRAEIASAEQSSLAALAKVIRQCAAVASNAALGWRTLDCLCDNQEHPVTFCHNSIATELRKELLALLTPEMLEAEQAQPTK